MATLSVIRRWALREQLSIREIARRTGLSRNTIRKYLRVAAYLKQIQTDPEMADEAAVLRRWQHLSDEESQLKKALKDLEAHVDRQAHDHYPRLSETEIQALVVDDKWLAAMGAAAHGELDRITQRLTQRVKELADRYDAPLPAVAKLADELQARVDEHLVRMGFTWN